MIFHASWKPLFNSLTTVNEFGNQNIVGFTGTMNFEANPNIKMVQINLPYGFLHVAISAREIIIPSTTPITLVDPSYV